MVSCFGPYERFRITIVEGEIAADGVFQLNGAAMGAAADLTLSEHGEPAFDLIEPRGRGRGEVHVKAWIACEPAFMAKVL